MKRKEYYDAEIKKQKARMFAEKQRIKQRLIDNATRNLMNQMAADESALEEQVEAMRKKEDDLEALKQRNIKEQKLAIDQACKSAMARRAREREEDARQTEEMVKAWRAKNKEIDDEAEADEKRRHDELMDLKKTQYEQREQYRARVRQERADRLVGRYGRGEPDSPGRFGVPPGAQREIDKAKAAGRPWYMLQKAKEAKERALFPSGGSGKAAGACFFFLGASAGVTGTAATTCAGQRSAGDPPASPVDGRRGSWRCGWRPTRGAALARVQVRR